MRLAVNPETPRDFLLYDGDCPVCQRLVAWSRLKASRPDIALLDARHEPALVARARAQGMEINDGIVLSLDGVVLYGADAMALVARLAEPDRLLVRWVLRPLRHDGIARPIYPLLVWLRKLLLRAIGRRLI